MKPDCIDMANFIVIPSPERVDCLVAQGIRRAIVGTSFGTVWQQQIAILELGGIEVQEYQFPTRFRFTHRKIWLDCETPVASVAAIRATAPQVHGIYTRRGWWIDETGDWDIVSEFPHLKLWEAHYGEPPPAFVPFGGWKKRDIIQYHDSTLFCGLNVDLNVIEEDEMPTQQEWDQHLNEFRALYGFALETRDAFFGFVKYMLKEQADDSAEAKAILARIEALETDG